MRHKINTDVEDMYGPGVVWGYTEDGDVIVCHFAEQMNAFRLPNNQWPVGYQYNGKNSKILILMAVPQEQVRLLEKVRKVSKP